MESLAHRRPLKTLLSSLGSIGRIAWMAAVLLYPLSLYFLTPPAVVVGVVLLVLYACRYGLEKEPSVGTGAFGTARLALRADLERAGMLADRGGLPLGRVDAHPPPLWPALRDLFLAPWADSGEVAARFTAALLSLRYGPPPTVFANRFFNLAVIAPPGAGKGAAIIIPALLRCPMSMVVLDPKGENFTLTARHRSAVLGHRVRRFDPFNVCGSGADSFNPLAALDPHSPTLVDDCLALADALVVKTGQEHDPHWNESAIAAITAFILYVTLYAQPEGRTLTAVAELVTDPKEFQHAVALMQDRNGMLAAKFGRSHGYDSLRRYGNQLSALVDKELSSVQSTINRHLAWTNSPLVQRSLGHSTLDLAELARSRTTLYLVMPPDKLESHNRLLRLWVTATSRALVRNGLQEKNPVLFLLDEVGNCGQLKALREGITMLRGYGARYAFVLQSVAQFKEMFGEGENTVKAGFDYTVFFGLRDHATAKEMSERMGKTTVRSRSDSETHGSSSPTFNFGLQGGGGGGSVNSSSTKTTTETGRDLVTPDELLSASERTVFVLPAGGHPIRLTQARYYEDPELAAAVARAGEPTDRAEPLLPASSVPPAVRTEPVDSGAADWAAISSGRPSAPPPRVPTKPAEDRLRFACPCGKRYSLAPAMAGKRAKCSNPRCTRVFVIPTRTPRPRTRAT